MATNSAVQDFDSVVALMRTLSIKLELAARTIQKQKAESELMSAELDRLTEEVREATTVAASATALIHGLAQQIRDAAGDQAKLAALADDLDASINPLSTAVSENTPSA